MRVVADSHAIVWYLAESSRLSTSARATLYEAESTEGIVVSVATLIDLWYVSRTTEAVTRDNLTEVRRWLVSSPAVVLYSVDVLVADETMSIPRDILSTRGTASSLRPRVLWLLPW